MASQNLSDCCKVVQLVAPDQYAAGAIAAAEIDTKGFRWATIIASVGTCDVSAALVLTESDTSGSGHAAIVDADSVAAEFTAASLNAGDTILMGELDLMHTERYLDATCTASSATDMSVVVILSNAKSTGDLITDAPEFQILNRA
jgi:hypothetical protein